MAEYIERETAIESLPVAWDSAINALLNAPAADVAEVVHGQWQGEGDGYADGALVYDVWNCSNCGYCIDDGTDDPERLPKYCPNCGARMDIKEQVDV